MISVLQSAQNISPALQWGNRKTIPVCYSERISLSAFTSYTAFTKRALCSDSELQPGTTSNKQINKLFPMRTDWLQVWLQVATLKQFWMMHTHLN